GGSAGGGGHGALLRPALHPAQHRRHHLVRPRGLAPDRRGPTGGAAAHLRKGRAPRGEGAGLRARRGGGLRRGPPAASGPGGGRGTGLKIGEAMGMGKPVVSTSLGAEGIEAVPGRDILLADAPADLALATVRLLRDSQLGQRMGSAARRLAEERYAWTAAAGA